jgi:hypothetical protein
MTYDREKSDTVSGLLNLLKKRKLWAPPLCPLWRIAFSSPLLAKESWLGRYTWDKRRNLEEGERFMSKKAAEHHRKASEHHTHAARHHGEAAKHHEAGHHEKAAHHAHTARAHAIHARGHAEGATVAHSEEHGKK